MLFPVCAVPSLTSWFCLLQYGEQGLQADAGGGPGGPGGPGGMNFGGPGGATFSFQASTRHPPQGHMLAMQEQLTAGEAWLPRRLFSWQAARTLREALPCD